jgi:4-hydroxybenzoate polyprenyltransferase
MNYYSIIPIFVTIIGFLLIRKRTPGMIKSWLIKSRPLIAVHYIFPTLLGIFIGHHIFRKPINHIDSFLLLCSVFFSFQTSVITNDIHDIRTDQLSKKKTLFDSSLFTIKQYNNLNIFFFVLSLTFALTINYRIFLIVIFGHIIHFLYSSKPFRLKRFFPLSIIMLSFGALLAAIAGFALFESSKPFLSFPLKPALFIVIPLFLGLNFRDLADYLGDKKTDVATLFTIFGLKRGKIINAILLLLSYLSIPIILQLPVFFIAAVPLGIASFYFCMKTPFKEKYIFYLYFVLIAIFIIVFNLNHGIIIG